MVIKYGFEINGIEYGWKSRKLYRLPQNIGNCYHSLKEMNLIPVGKKEGYRVAGKRKTIEQLEAITVPMKRIVSTIKHEDLPF